MAYEENRDSLMKRKIVIIGGGASGLFLSSLIPEALLLEKNNTVGKKLSLTGGGKCNLTHEGEPRDTVSHYYDKKRFISPSIYTFPPVKIREYFSSLSLDTYIRSDGKVFPKSEKSSDVISALTKGEIALETKVLSVTKNNDSFILTTNNGVIEAEKVVVATGGSSFPQTGSDGSFFSVLSLLGHKIIPLRPALSSLKVMENMGRVEGITVEDVSIKYKKIKKEGSILFTRNGISGPEIMNISREVENESQIEISLSSFPPSELFHLKGNMKAIKALHEETSLPMRLLEERLSWKDKKIGDLSKNDSEEYRNKFYKWTPTVTTKGMLNSSTVTRGGVDTEEVDPVTFKSKLVPNLWIIGEALDVDGECGGYNLTFAFASAYSAYLSLTKE